LQSGAVEEFSLNDSDAVAKWFQPLGIANEGGHLMATLHRPSNDF
jgi:hypothetical protein